jgi:hypothetical protein
VAWLAYVFNIDGGSFSLAKKPHFLQHFFGLLRLHRKDLFIARVNWHVNFSTSIGIDNLE